MSERGVTKVMSKCYRLGQVFIERKLAGDGSGELSNFYGVGEPGPEHIPFVIDENLGFVFEPAKGGAVYNAVTVALKLGTM